MTPPPAPTAKRWIAMRADCLLPVCVLILIAAVSFLSGGSERHLESQCSAAAARAGANPERACRRL